MASHYLTMQGKRLLALRSAVPVLLLAVPCLAVGVRTMNWGETESALALLGSAILTAIAFLLVYAFRLTFPNRKLWLEPGFTAERPAYALRAAFGASTGLYVASFLIAASIYLKPLAGPRRIDFFTVLIGGATAGVALGALIFLFAGVLYLRVHRDDPKAGNSSGFGVLPFVMMFQGVSSELKNHSFWTAVGLTAWTNLSIFAALALGWFAYTNIAPEAPNPFPWRRKRSAKAAG